MRLSQYDAVMRQMGWSYLDVDDQGKPVELWSHPKVELAFPDDQPVNTLSELASSIGEHRNNAGLSNESMDQIHALYVELAKKAEIEEVLADADPEDQAVDNITPSQAEIRIPREIFTRPFAIHFLCFAKESASPAQPKTGSVTIGCPEDLVAFSKRIASHNLILQPDLPLSVVVTLELARQLGLLQLTRQTISPEELAKLERMQPSLGPAPLAASAPTSS